MNLVIDIGNTRIKIAFFDGNKLIESKVFKDPMVCDFELELRQRPQTDSCILSATADIDPQLFKYISNTFPNLIQVSGSMPLPFKNEYESKNTQGPDRIAAIAGARELYPNTPLLVIDAGTAITYDFLNSQGVYEGGNIAPGLSVRFKSLHDFTDKLPLLEKRDDFNLLGKQTNQAIVSGVQNGIIFEIERYIQILEEMHPNLTTIMTGGDSVFLANKLKRTIFVHENLVLIGLNRILTYNAQL